MLGEKARQGNVFQHPFEKSNKHVGDHRQQQRGMQRTSEEVVRGGENCKVNINLQSKQTSRSESGELSDLQFDWKSPYVLFETTGVDSTRNKDFQNVPKTHPLGIRKEKQNFPPRSP